MNKNLFYKNSTILKVLFLTVLSFYLFTACFKNDDENKWFDYTKDWLEKDILLITTADKKEALKYFNLREKVGVKLRECKPPKVKEIERLIQSKDNEDQAIACLAVCHFNIYSHLIIDKIVSNFRIHKNYREKRYEILALEIIEIKDLEPFEKEIFDSIEAEVNARNLTESLLILERFPPEKTSDIVTDILLNKGDKGTKIVAYTVLYMFGEKYAHAAKEKLRQKGDIETLEAIESKPQ